MNPKKRYYSFFVFPAMTLGLFVVIIGFCAFLYPHADLSAYALKKYHSATELDPFLLSLWFGLQYFLLSLFAVILLVGVLCFICYGDEAH